MRLRLLLSLLQGFTLNLSQLLLHVSPWQQLQLRGIALGLIRLLPGEGDAFTHNQELADRESKRSESGQ